MKVKAIQSNSDSKNLNVSNKSKNRLQSLGNGLKYFAKFLSIYKKMCMTVGVVLFIWLFNSYFINLPIAYARMVIIIIAGLILMASLLYVVKKNNKLVIPRLALFGTLGVYLVYALKLFNLRINGYNILDVTAITSFPVLEYIAAPLIALIFVLLVVNIYENKKDKTGFYVEFLNNLQLFAVISIVLNTIFVSLLFVFRKSILAKTGWFFYLLQSAIAGFANTISLQVILSLTFGNAFVSLVVFLLLFSYWLNIGRVSHKLTKIIGYVVALAWLGASFLLAITSYNLLTLWLIGVVGILVKYYQNYYKKGVAYDVSRIKYLLISVILVIGLLITGFVLAHQSILGGLNNIYMVVKAEVIGLVDYFKVLFNAKKILSLSSIALYPVIFSLAGYFVGMGSEIISVATLLNTSVNNTAFFNYLVSFGLMGLMIFVSFVYLSIKFMKTHKSFGTVLLFVLAFVPMFLQMNSVLYMVYLGMLLMLMAYTKQEFESYNISKPLCLVLGLSMVFGFGVLYYWFNLSTNYYAFVTNKNKALNDLADIYQEYVKNKKDAKNVTDIQSLVNKDKVATFKQDFTAYLISYKKFVNYCNQCEQAKIGDFDVVSSLFDLGMQNKELYNYLFNVPNIEAQNQFVKAVYSMQETAWIPSEYKLLGNAWYNLALQQKTPVFTQRALVNYDKVLVYAPLDTQVLQTYLGILLQQYSSLNQSGQNTDVKVALENKIQGLLSLLNRAGVIRLQSTGQIDVMLAGAVLQAQYYKLAGNEKKAEESFDIVKKVVDTSKLKKEEKEKLLKLIEQVKAKTLGQKSFKTEPSTNIGKVDNEKSTQQNSVVETTPTVTQTQQE